VAHRQPCGTGRWVDEIIDRAREDLDALEEYQCQSKFQAYAAATNEGDDWRHWIAMLMRESICDESCGSLQRK
jgi:hypothetical protein